MGRFGDNLLLTMSEIHLMKLFPEKKLLADKVDTVEELLCRALDSTEGLVAHPCNRPAYAFHANGRL